MSALDPFKKAHDRANAAVLRHLANARASWMDGVEFGVILDAEIGDGFPEVVTADQYTLSMCVANAAGIAEGSSELVINGRPCRVTGAVVPDASGWATFPIVFEEGAHAGP